MRPSLILIIALMASRVDALHIIHIVDDQTNRSVPMVELETVNHIKCVTDSNGVVAFDEPGLMNCDVWFSIKSHGYEYPADGFGSRGKTILTKDGGKTTLKIKRINVAERLYRITGQGIYGESVKAGLTVPIDAPVLNGQVMGQDSVQLVVYRDKLYWFWGDTQKTSYTLGQFGTSGATSELPGKGRLDPAVGVNLKYFVDKTGFSRPMVDLAPGSREKPPGAVWIGGLMTAQDDSGVNRLVATYSRVKDLGTLLERGLLIYNDEHEMFEKWKEIGKDEPLYPNGRPVKTAGDAGADYFYFPVPYAVIRVPAKWSAIGNLHEYEALTCLKAGTRYAREKSQLDRDSRGHLLWAWKRDTGVITEKEQQELLKAGLIKTGEALFDLKDAGSGKTVVAHGGTICWNEYRKKWVMIVVEFGGSSSLLGEMWYSEADKIDGPFRKAVKIATHDKQTFYNPVQHPEFDQDGGRVIYFEGTYCNTFSGNPEQTARYDYNQMMYRLDLSDTRLKPAQVR